MAAELRAIPDVLVHAGSALAGHGRALLVLQQSTHRDVDGAQQGWVGSSAVALPGLLDRWAATAARHQARLGDHVSGMRLAAAGFTQVDQDNAAALR